jgi:ribosomal protein L10
LRLLGHPKVVFNFRQMKTKSQKATELKEAEKFLKGSDALVFVDFNKVTAEDLRRLRRDVGASGASILVMKKRLLNVLFKEKGIDMDARRFKSSLGTVFSKTGLEAVSGAIYKFFNSLGGTDKELKAAAIRKILGGYDLTNKEFADAQKIVFYGQLPSREVALGMVLGMFVAPLRAFMHILNEKSKQS